MSDPFVIDIAICTYRRSSLADTLSSIATVIVPDSARLRIIVADNDSEPSARGLIEALRDGFPHELVYVHCPASNISLARNTCLDHATGLYLAFVDDDELVTRDWLTALVAKAGATGAAAVLGPVSARYGSDAPKAIVAGDFHSTKPVFVNGDIITGYTCNLLLDRRAPSVRGRRFDLSLGSCGGEDTAYLSGVHASGGMIAYEQRALVIEPVPASRASFDWLARRRFRSGQTHARMLLERTAGRARLPQASLAALKATACLAACAAFFLRPVGRGRFYLRAVLHLGVVAGLIGLREARLYGAPVIAGGGNSHDV